LNIPAGNAINGFVIQSELKSERIRTRGINIIRAAHLGMCFGVRDAIALARDEAESGPLTILGQLVHNEAVLAELRDRGIRLENRLDEVSTRAVMITAHGASEKTVRSAKERGLQVLEATCPLVHFAHRVVQTLAGQGFHPVIVGRRDHVEVRGLTEDLEEFDVVLNEEDVFRLVERPRFGVAAQTTQPIDRVQHLVDLIRRRFPRSEIRFQDTVCQPTKQRQLAAIEMARQADMVIVVGGANSNNTRELAATCRFHCLRVHQVADADDLCAAWLEEAETVGLTAGTSTPDYVIDGVEFRLRTLAQGRDSGLDKRGW
jgi:4-hydroxy-3-methylbut-2-enyl diphosphate reductase